MSGGDQGKERAGKPPSEGAGPGQQPESGQWGNVQGSRTGLKPGQSGGTPCNFSDGVGAAIPRAWLTLGGPQ